MTSRCPYLLLALLLCPAVARADVQSLTVYPPQVVLHNGDETSQLIVTAVQPNGRLQDLTGDVKYAIADPKIAQVTPAGRVQARSNGATQITVRHGDRTVSVPVRTEHVGENLPINFANQVVPVFTKLGCNSGGCHGKLAGQNGFHLSLLGFEPDVDYNALVKESKGRRLFLAAPERSLLLLKATGQLAHGGGKRLEVESDEYRLIRRWIAAGVPVGRPDDPVVTGLSVYPPQRQLTRQNHQQLAAYAHYSDGSVEDITRRAQYDSNDPDLAVVEQNGLVRTLNLSGEAAIMARYQGHVAVFRATVPLGVPVPSYAFEPRTLVDRYTLRKWQELGLVPSEVCPDDQFIRRAYLDLTGTLPTPDQVRAFVNDPSPAKRDRLIDDLVETPEYSYFFANKWADILRVKRGRQQGRANGTFAFHGWIRDAIAQDMPYDEFVRAILTASGDEDHCPPTVWYKDLRTADEFVDNASQVFLGTRIQCAQCHHHPYEKWSQDDYWGMAAFYARINRKPVPVPGETNGNNQQHLVLYVRQQGTVNNKRTGRPAPMKPLDSEPETVPPGDDPRQVLADWMVDAHNPFFAKAVANRYWAHFFSRGIVDPLDDMRVTNPPSNPELLDALARDLVESKFSLKHLVKTICKSRTYQLSSTPNEFNQHDKQAFSRYYARRMTAEVLFDAVCQVTDSPASFNGLPQDAHAPRRAIMLPDESFTSYFLDVFGRPQRISACECERVSEANLAQALHLLNSEEVQQKIARSGGRADQLARDPRPDAEKIEELFVWAVGHKPDAKKLKLAVEHVQAAATGKQKSAYEDILWALLNTKEFIYNR